MPIGATIAGAVATVGAAAVGVIGAKKAAKTEADAANKATDTQLGMYNQTRDDLKPYNDVGKSATYSLAALYGLPGADGTVKAPDYSGFTSSPDYAFAKSEGIKSLDASASAKGNLLSGGMFKDLEDYASGLATQNYGNYVSRLSDLAHLGEGAGAQVGSIGANVGANVANTQMSAGQASAAGTVAATNAITNGIGNGLKLYNQAQGYNNTSAYLGSQPIATGNPMPLNQYA